MRIHDDTNQHDALNDRLDALAGAPSASSRANDLDAEMRDSVDRFFDLAEQAGATSARTHHRRRPSMDSTLPTSSVLPAPQRKRNRTIAMPAWTQHLHIVSTGLLIVAVVALSFAAFSPNGIGTGNNGTGSGGAGDGPNLNGAVPVATVPDNAVTSTLPYPGPEECTVEPMTRDEVIARLKEANVSVPQRSQLYESWLVPSDQQIKSIIETYNEWRACGLDGFGPEYQLRFETPLYTAERTPVFYSPDGENLRPVPEAEIERWVDRVLNEENSGTPAPTVASGQSFPSTPIPPGSNEMGTPFSIDGTETADSPLRVLHNTDQERLPIPAGSTPVASGQGGRAFQVILAEDIVITGPDTATATAYFIDEQTREITHATPYVYTFVYVDGVWKIDSVREGIGLG